LLADADRAERLITRNVVSPAFDLGRWAEAGRLAALAGDVATLSRPAFRELLNDSGLAAELGDEVARIERLLEADPPDAAGLREAFGTIVREHGTLF
jgi:hypothetical protein